MTAAKGDVRLCGPLAFFGLVALLSTGALADAETIFVQRHVQMLGLRECTYGPSFWCKNITNAAGCNAVKHCIQTTWVTQTYPEDNDDICIICKNIVQEARDLLTSNVTLEEFKEVFDGSCGLLSLKIVKKECQKLSDDFIPELVDTLASQMDSNAVCSVSGLCNNAHIDKLILENKEKAQEAIQIEEDSSFTAKKEQNEHKPTLLMVDEKPRKVKNINVTKKSEVIDVFYKEMHFVVNDVSMPTDKTTCFLCQSILNYVQQVVSNPKSEAEIRTALEKSCFVVPRSFEQQCKQFVDQYGDVFISLIAQEVDPSSICPELKLCPVTDLSLTSNEDSESSNNCPMCVIFMSALESEISNEDTEEVIKKKLEKLCTKLPSKWKGECTEFVSTQLQSILDMLIAQVKIEEICVLLDICKPKTISESAENDLETNMIATDGQITLVFPGYNMGQLMANNYKMLEEPKVTIPFDCIVCKTVMKYLNGEIKDKSNQEIEHTLESTCSALPNVVENECQSFIDSNYQQIIKCIAIETDPGIPCAMLMMCDDDKFGDKQTIGLHKKNVHLTTTGLAELNSSNSCAACKAFATVFENLFKVIFN
ncbi:unnamed protein product [Macrosiphum euphorbiae]|uniref:Prosaposin n=1 Tax=Macrosiphum euphorbiae TaxID=13131 RepID=A0AAV0YBX8_9HEMI|nr:unnamed protein product [Macrosiphum euphorbiae]